jgi:hypothetical protein
VSSPNPGISAAGEAAGRTALNPSTGPAAIGGMLSPGEAEPEPPVHHPVRSPVEDRLTTVVSDITRLAAAMGALSLALYPEEPAPPETPWERSGGGQYAAAGGDSGSVNGGGTTEPTHGLGATGAATAGIGGYASVPIASTDAHRQAASRYRA